MLSIQRRDEIYKIMLERRSVTVAEMAKHFGVSTETIRRDFEVLESEGILTKSYGGAVIKKHVKSKIDSSVYEELIVDNKQRIAKKAAELIHPGDSIFLDSSTTALHICEEIKDVKLNVMTNSLKVLSKLALYPNVNLVSTGGELDLHSLGFFGRAAVKYLSNFYLDKAFISCRSISMDKGLSDNEEKEAEMHQAVIENADSVYLLVDHIKFDRVSFVQTSNIENITAIVTDHMLSDSWREFLKTNKIDYYEQT